MPQSQVAQQQKSRDKIARVAQKAIRGEQEFTTGVTTESVRTKQFPEDALPGQPTQIAFVVNVRLLEHPGQPVARDVLVANQARQWIADDSGVPVQLKKDKTGRLTVVGRSGYGSDEARLDFYPIHSIDGSDLSFLFGMEYLLFGSLSADLQTLINNYRTSLGLSTLSAGDGIYKDPVLHVLGENYVQGYIPVSDSVRGSAGGSLICTQQTVLVPWDDVRWRWGLAPVGFDASTSSWGWRETTTVCTP